jgi:hypothetical protein
MADNTLQDGSDLIATDEVTHSGDTADVQLFRPVHVTGAEGSKTVVDLTTVLGAMKVAGDITHDTGDQGAPVKIGGKANAAAPADVSANNDRVEAWFLRNGAQMVGVQAAGALIGGDATNGLDVDVTRLPGVAGDTAHDAVDAGNPVKIGGIANSSTPTGVTNGDRVNQWFGPQGQIHATLVDGIGAKLGALVPSDGLSAASGLAVNAQGMLFNGTSWDRIRGDITNGLDVDVTRLPLPHAAIGTALSIAAAFTTTQTSTNLIAGTGGQKIYVTSLTIATGGTTAGRVSIYYGTGAFTAGTSVTLFDGEFAPSATSKPGAVLTFPIPIGGASATGDNLSITTSAAMTVYISGQAYKA